MKALKLLPLSILLAIHPINGYAAEQQTDFINAVNKEFNKSSAGKCLEDYPCFKVSNDYPRAQPPAENYPWLQFNYASQPKEYMEAVLDYVMDGNIEVDWEVSKNSVRKWYHAPWMHMKREPIHGLTRERGSRRHELSEFQTRKTNNWAVGFYNAPGGYVLSEVWQDPASPDAKKARFPVGTVAAKILFTDATDKEAPFMTGGASLTWDAQIDLAKPPQKLRLLQLDIAVRDANVDQYTGWLFGTFMFYGPNGSDHYWENIIPVGIHWGNDPEFTYADYRNGDRPVEGWVNPFMKTLFAQRPPFGELGYLGRVNGPVDNPFSSCLSCHGRAIDVAEEKYPDFAPQYEYMCINRIAKDMNETYELIDNGYCDGYNDKEVKKFFRNLKPHEPFVDTGISLDYSLQLSHGIRNWRYWFNHNYPNLYAQKNP